MRHTPKRRFGSPRRTLALASTGLFLPQEIIPGSISSGVQIGHQSYGDNVLSVARQGGVLPEATLPSSNRDPDQSHD